LNILLIYDVWMEVGYDDKHVACCNNNGDSITQVSVCFYFLWFRSS